MTNYYSIAKYYDCIMGDRLDSTLFITDLISKHNPHARNILDIACGTGTTLKALSEKYDKYGLDISEEMLSIARKKVNNATFYQQDIRNFKLQSKFDIILCLFDSINHLVDFNDWKKVFLNVSDHLNDDGTFVFDVNTIYKLERMIKKGPQEKQLDGCHMTMEVTKGDNDVTNWNIRIQEGESNSIDNVYTENIVEKSYEFDKINAALKDIFSEITATDREGKQLTGNSERIYFVCKK